MRRIIALTAVFMAGAVMAFAQNTPWRDDPQKETMTVKGSIVDNLNVSTKTPEQLTEFVKTYTKNDVLPSKNAEKGYSIFADGKLYSFDGDSGMKVNQFLQKPENKLQVVAEVKSTGERGIVSLISIRNQE